MKKILIALASVGLIGMTGCNKFLDTMPDNRTQIDNLEKVNALLVSAYPYKSFIPVVDASCDGFVDHGSTYNGSQPGESYNIGQERAFLWGEYPSAESSEGTPEAYWQAAYAAIAAANIAMQSLDEMVANHTITAEEAVAPRAEALLCRAYAHFCVLTLFADFFDRDNWSVKPGIPYVTEPENVVIKEYHRETIDVTLGKVKKDLEEGMAGIGTSKNKFHFSRNAALALACRIALFEGDYPAVQIYADQLIPTATDFLTLGTNGDGSARRTPRQTDRAYLYVGSNFANWNSIGNQPGADAVMQAASDPRYQPSILLATECYSLLGRTTFGNAYVRYSLSARQLNVITGNNATGSQWNYPVYAVTGAVGFVPKFYEDFKMTNIQAQTGLPHCKVTLFRQEEMLLARAEAKIMMGDYDGAIDDLNLYPQNRVSSSVISSTALYRDKILDYYAEILDNPEHWINSDWNEACFSAPADTATGRLERALILTVLDFRRSEFLAEGMRWFDILRYHIPVTHTRASGASSTLEPDDDRRLLQVPATAELSNIQKNPRTTPDW